MTMTLPKITIEGILSTLSQAQRLGSPGDFVLDWEEKMNEENQGDLCEGVVSLVDGFYDDDDYNEKVHCAAVVAIVVNSILAAIEAEELEKMFQESA